jgi:hypothetical protein
MGTSQISAGGGRESDFPPMENHRVVTVYLPARPCRHRITLGSLGFHRQFVSMDHKRLDPLSRDTGTRNHVGRLPPPTSSTSPSPPVSHLPPPSPASQSVLARVFNLQPPLILARRPPAARGRGGALVAVPGQPPSQTLTSTYGRSVLIHRPVRQRCLRLRHHLLLHLHCPAPPL